MSRASLIGLIALICATVAITAFHIWLRGLNDDFRGGFVSGLGVGMSVIFLLSRRARQLP
jgi:hypothetical protein